MSRSTKGPLESWRSGEVVETRDGGFNCCMVFGDGTKSDSEQRAQIDPEFARNRALEIQHREACEAEVKLEASEKRRQDREEARDKKRAIKHERDEFWIGPDGEGDLDSEGYAIDKGYFG